MENANLMPNDNKQPKKNDRRKFLIIGLVAFVVIGGMAGIIYYLYLQTSIYIDLSEINAPTINLSSKTGGTLKAVMVKPGDYVGENTPVARVGDELVKSDKAGLIITVNNNLGKNFQPGETVVAMIYPEDLRAVGHISEDKGLSQIQIGQTVIFTVDAFGSKKYFGVVDEISPVANQQSVVFNISDQRPENQFDVKVRFNINAYPEFKPGMSAKMWINK